MTQPCCSENNAVYIVLMGMLELMAVPWPEGVVAKALASKVEPELQPL
jgi:hypothetical protein